MRELTDPMTGTDALGDPCAPELGSIESSGENRDSDAATAARGDATAARDESAVNKTGTTTVGVASADGVVMDDEYTVTGSGMALAYGTIEGQYDPEMDLDEARDLAVRAVAAACERDTGSGNGVTVATVTGDGVDVETFDETTEALA
jgi:20S proteasome alpha/beta subunit